MPEHYRIFDITVSCDFPLPELPSSPSGQADISISMGTGEWRQHYATGFQLAYEWRTADERLICWCERRGDEYLFVFTDFAAFHISSGGKTLCYPLEMATDQLLRHLLLNQVIPRYLATGGRLVLHAAAITLAAGKTIAFLGNSGFGKSTLVSSFHRHGAQLINDDCIMLERSENGVIATGGLTGIRLFPDSVNAVFTESAGFTNYTPYTDKQLHVCHAGTRASVQHRVQMILMRLAVLLALLVFNAAVLAHTDLHLQINHLGSELAKDPTNTDLLMKRGDLHRRHQDWQAAWMDFDRVRQLEPDHADIDWFAGRLEVESGNPAMGVALLDRFLLKNKDHPIALQNRAQGHLQLGQPLLAALDYKTVLQTAGSPGPELYRACAEAYVKAGASHFVEALAIIRKGLEKLPAEVSLTGIATDLSLAQGDTESAHAYIDSLPPPVLHLVQWKLRIALLDCQTGRAEKAAQGFRDVMADPSRGRKDDLLPSEAQLRAMASDPDPEQCRAAANRF